MSRDVTDLSPGTVLIAGSSGWRYTVTTDGDESVSLRGPHGPQTVPRDELQRDIARGMIRVVS
jgi:hypothetical protein